MDPMPLLTSIVTLIGYETVKWLLTPATPDNWSLYTDVMGIHYRVVMVDPMRGYLQYKPYSDDTDKSLTTCSIAMFHKLKLTKVSK